MRFKGFYWAATAEHHAEDWAALQHSGANSVVIPRHAVTTDLLAALREQGMLAYVDLALFAGSDLRLRFPTSAPIDEAGAIMGADGWYVPACPNHPALRAQHLADLQQLLLHTSDMLAGVWLDFIRYPMRWEVAQPRLMQACFCDRCLSLFHAAEERSYSAADRRHATRAILAEQANTWTAWKCHRIADYVKQIAALVRQYPHLRLGLFALPWRLSDHQGGIRTIVGQDLALLGQIVDTISPMVYHRLCYRDPSWIAAVIHEARARSHAPILPVVQSLDQPHPLADTELAQAIAIAAAAAHQDTIIFDLRSVARDTAKLAAVRNMLAQIG
ncbi:MAG TPA: hypothetical protein PKA05_23745 [Roseiflexaceae bacterium]|nr:hypothetical protein [Roseiflexaceae bacterium]HMP43407.1 hypothetical protein [Roseiflexaceae bacterium]